jgi:hypothetical protein
MSAFGGKADIAQTCLDINPAVTIARSLSDKRTIWENTLDNLTSGVFVQMWQDQVKRFYTHYSEATTN